MSSKPKATKKYRAKVTKNIVKQVLNEEKKQYINRPTGFGRRMRSIKRARSGRARNRVNDMGRERKFEGVEPLVAATEFGYDYFDLLANGSSGAESFPWYISTLQKHSEWIINSMDIIYEPSLDAMKSGDIIVLHQPDYFGPVPVTLADGTNFSRHKHDTVRNKITWHLDAKDFGTKFKSVNQIRELGGFGYIYIGYNCSTAGQIGLLKWRVDITVKNPVMPPAAISTTGFRPADDISVYTDAGPYLYTRCFGDMENNLIRDYDNFAETVLDHGYCQPAGVNKPTVKGASYSYDTEFSIWQIYAKPGTYLFRMKHALSQALSIYDGVIHVASGTAHLVNVICDSTVKLTHLIEFAVHVTKAAWFSLTTVFDDPTPNRVRKLGDWYCDCTTDWILTRVQTSCLTIPKPIDLPMVYKRVKIDNQMSRVGAFYEAKELSQLVVKREKKQVDKPKIRDDYKMEVQPKDVVVVTRTKTNLHS